MAPAIASATDAPNTDKSSNLSYYSTPYGYQSQGIASPYVLQLQQQQQHQQQSLAAAQQQQQQQKPQQTNYQQQHSTYIQSGAASIAPTQTTKSASEYSFGATQPATTPKAESPTPTKEVKPDTAATQSRVETKPTAKPVKKSTNIDLLTDIDLSGVGLAVPPPILPQPLLKPIIVASPPSSEVAVEVKAKEEVIKHLQTLAEYSSRKVLLGSTAETLDNHINGRTKRIKPRRGAKICNRTAFTTASKCKSRYFTY